MTPRTRTTAGRLRVAIFPIACVITVGAVLRCVLYARFHEGVFSASDFATAVAAGVGYDALVAILASMPWLFAIAALRLRLLSLTTVRFVTLGAFGGLLTFGAFVEYFYFDEFDTRYNHIALDYLLHPREVFGNIWDSYNVPMFAALAGLAGLVIGWAALRFTRGAAFDPAPWRLRRRWLATVAGAGILAAAMLELAPSDVSSDRILSEVAQNGLDRLVHAFRTGELDFDRYYRTLPPTDAHRRAAALLGLASGPRAASDVELTQAPGLRNEGPPRDWDVVVILEESFGSEFVGVLGHTERKMTPGFDRWSREGTLLTNLTATGNRTVRGLEGTLCSLVPLPGNAVLRRMKHKPVATLASVFQSNGYETMFFYGGWGTFDDMKPFFPENGFDEFIERGAYPADAFRTVWGVADEYVFDELLERQQDARSRGKRVFATVMTVSNHKPFDVPERGTAWPASQRNRDSGIAYADWALADYLDHAKAAGLLEHTLVVIAGDHGARVYGSQQVPVASYRIPGLLLVPDPAWHERRIERVASQIDLAPTILALARIPTPVPFLGTSLVGLPEDGGRAFVQHNRDVGILTDTALVTLGLSREVDCYRRSGRESDSFVKTGCADRQLSSLADDAAAVFQTAGDMLEGGTYALLPSRLSPEVEYAGRRDRPQDPRASKARPVDGKGGAPVEIGSDF